MGEKYTVVKKFQETIKDRLLTTKLKLDNSLASELISAGPTSGGGTYVTGKNLQSLTIILRGSEKYSHEVIEATVIEYISKKTGI